MFYGGSVVRFLFFFSFFSVMRTLDTVCAFVVRIKELTLFLISISMDISVMRTLDTVPL